MPVCFSNKGSRRARRYAMTGRSPTLDDGDGKEVDPEKCPRADLQRQCTRYLGPEMWPYSSHYCPIEESCMKFISFLVEHHVGFYNVKAKNSITLSNNAYNGDLDINDLQIMDEILQDREKRWQLFLNENVKHHKLMCHNVCDPQPFKLSKVSAKLVLDPIQESHPHHLEKGE
ncbi:hypothetical protein POM88_028221 [Heracleum sosnowskyi]|uniref:Uncharacterized protein n=1 Tax=Heracleum sosnowskyi TaxID=360622 RepID=A0AAD8IBI5_9APIA|nr:hypothetical protein POM88_028221 [Heracleum sosnowskyi]